MKSERARNRNSLGQFRSRYFHRLVLSFFFLLLLLGYTNCAENSGDSSGSSNQSSSAPGLKPINYFKSTPPSSLSGEEGYNFLMKEYFGPQCAACHDGVIFPSFASKKNTHDSYLAAKYYFRSDDMVMRITDNPFCRPACSLDPRGEVYKGIMTWLEQR